MKPLLPSLKERKRYLAFEVMADKAISFKVVAKAVWNGVLSFLGTKGNV